jgi:glycosyltransferase involved in cell wall biosynthesis
MKRKSNSPQIHFWIPNTFDFKGGIQVYLYKIIEVLAINYNDISVTIFNKLDKGLIQDIESENIAFVYTGHIFSLIRTFYFSLIIFFSAITERPNLILCGHINFAPVGFLIDKLLGIPYCILVYGVDCWNIKQFWKKAAIHNASKIISIGEYTANRLIQEQKINRKQFYFLPCTFDSDRFKIESKPHYLLEKYHLNLNQKIILTVTRLSQTDGYKGYDKIISALPQIIDQIPNIHYLLVGKGDDRLRIEKLIKQLNLEKYVTLTGFVSDEQLCDHYNLCDVFAMPSKGEGFGIVYLEALACGKPTLGGNQDGAIDALCNGELGALVDPDNVDEIANTLIQILQGTYSNSLLYQPENLREKAINTFGFQKFTQTLQEHLHNFDYKA